MQTIHLDTQRTNERKHAIKSIKIYAATHHMLHVSPLATDIANAVNVNPDKILHWAFHDPQWDQALRFWTGFEECHLKPLRELGEPKGNKSPYGDLHKAKAVWTEMIENGGDLSDVEHPDSPVKSESGGDFAVYALINSHLFCVDNLTPEDVKHRLAAEDNDGLKPVRYDSQDLENAYHWWVFPNEAEGIYSKVLARVNVAGDLVVDFAGETCLVCIRYGRFTLTRQIADDVVNVSDERLLVCL